MNEVVEEEVVPVQPEPGEQFEKLSVHCSKCDNEFSLRECSFNEPDKEQGHDYNKVGFRCVHCGYEQIAFWTTDRLRKKATKLKALRKRARGVPGVYKQYQELQAQYQDYFDKVQKKARKRLDAKKPTRAIQE